MALPRQEKYACGVAYLRWASLFPNCPDRGSKTLQSNVVNTFQVDRSPAHHYHAPTRAQMFRIKKNRQDDLPKWQGVCCLQSTVKCHLQTPTENRTSSFSIPQRGLGEVPRQENARYAFTITRRKEIKGTESVLLLRT